MIVIETSGLDDTELDKCKLLQIDKLNKPFNITSVCRVDLTEYFTTNEIERFSDDDMEYLASKMADAYCDSGYWIDLKIIAEHILEDKDKEVI